MARSAYLVVPDLHMGNLITPNRIDYRNEILHVQKYLLQTAVKYKREGWEVVLLLLGDVFHNSYKDVFDAITDHDFLILWKQNFGKIYSVLGNHELSYYKSNPFYTLINRIESARVQKIMNHVWTPLGAEDIVCIPDQLSDGEVTFYFNHYNTLIQQPDANVSIGLFHQDLTTSQILADVEREHGIRTFSHPVDLENSHLLDGYDYCFMGHLHTVYGIWRTETTELCYLASLGRTNITEVDNKFLERCIPVVKVADGSFQKIEYNYFELLPREQCVVEEIVERQRELYCETQEVRQMRSYVPLGDDPMKNLCMQFAENPMACKIIQDLMQQEMDDFGKEIKRKLRCARIEN